MAQLPQNERGRREQAAEDVDEADLIWMQIIAHEWREELAEPREDIYTEEDGEPIAEARNKTHAGHTNACPTDTETILRTQGPSAADH